MMFQGLTRTNSPFCEDFSEKVSCFGLWRAERRKDAFPIVFFNEQCSHTQYLSLVLYGIQLESKAWFYSVNARWIWVCSRLRPSRSQMKIRSKFRSACAEFTKKDNTETNKIVRYWKWKGSPWTQSIWAAASGRLTTSRVFFSGILWARRRLVLQRIKYRPQKDFPRNPHQSIWRTMRWCKRAPSWTRRFKKWAYNSLCYALKNIVFCGIRCSWEQNIVSAPFWSVFFVFLNFVIRIFWHSAIFETSVRRNWTCRFPGSGSVSEILFIQT